MFSGLLCSSELTRLCSSFSWLLFLLLLLLLHVELKVPKINAQSLHSVNIIYHGMF
jgi:hypothetical protein